MAEKVTVVWSKSDGTVALSNGVRTGCRVTSAGPDLKSGDEVALKGGAWVKVEKKVAKEKATKKASKKKTSKKK